MYESYTRQALPDKAYRELLGTALCVFNSNNSFIIENILKNDIDKVYNWYELIDRESGKLIEPVKKTISEKSGSDEIADLFDTIVKKRNRIVHSFQITDRDGKQRLATKNKTNNNQFVITEKILKEFIKKNEKLSILLHEFRGY